MTSSATSGQVPTRYRCSSLVFGRLAAVVGLLALTACGAGASDERSESRPLQGQLMVYVADYEDHEGLIYELRAGDGQRYRLLFAEPPALKSGVVLQLNTFEHTPDDQLRVLEFEAVEPALRQLSQPLVNADPAPTRRVAVLLAEGSSVTPTEALNRLKNDENSLANYFRNNSFGIQDLDGEVFGPYPSPAASSGCDMNAVSDELIAAFEAEGHSTADFDHFAHALPAEPNCSFVGLAELGTPNNPQQRSWYKTNLNRVLFPHEIGHNFGLAHPVMLRCSEVPFADPSSCDSSLNGHPFDPLGGGFDHYSAFNKGFLGWFGGCNTVTAGADGVFNLFPLNQPCDGIQTIRVATGVAGHSFHLDYRKDPIVFDSEAPEFAGVGPSGVNVDVAPPDFGDGNSLSPVVLSIDMIPEQFGTQSYLVLNQPYTAPSGVTITLISLDEQKAQVRLQFPAGGSGSNQCLDGTAAPHTVTGNVGTDTCSDGGGGGGSGACDGVSQWIVGTRYSEGDEVQSAGAKYRCRAWPYSGHCGQAGYQPGVDPAWPDAWVKVSDCDCAPRCDGRQCGADGCGGSCGTCQSDQSCDSSGQCIAGNVCTGVPAWDPNQHWTTYKKGDLRTRNARLFVCHTNYWCYLDPTTVSYGALGWTERGPCTP